MASRFTPIVPINHSQFWPPPRVQICHYLHQDQGLFLYTKSFLAHSRYAQQAKSPPHKKLMQMGASYLMRTHNLMDRIELQALCQSHHQGTSMRPLIICWLNSRAMRTRSATNLPNWRIAKQRRCLPAFLLVYAPRVSCALFGMAWRKARSCFAMPRSLQSRPTWIGIIFAYQSWMVISSMWLLPKQPAIWKVRNIHLTNSPSSKKNHCKMLAIEYSLIDNRCMAPRWDLFINSAEMECILGIRVKVQVFPPLGEQDPNLITMNRWLCKHHINYSSKIWYIQHKKVINLDHPITLVLTDGSHPPHSVSTLCHN